MTNYSMQNTESALLLQKSMEAITKIIELRERVIHLLENRIRNDGWQVGDEQEYKKLKAQIAELEPLVCTRLID